ncbi:Qat anti-phage system TatD family nuclease QatD [Otariodibacter sp.]|uniref:Qat anti-phage system TatD family nuclease QatD n=1 Tax=Otariodibacter sp. TaxID=3030919 RepID=UPI0026280229|nr:Qat anti-phage system TatD family nuclease QatD [Otariodibacter sp.]
MIDLHTHLDLYPDSLNILERVNKENHFTLAVTTSPKAWLATSHVFKEYNNIMVALGLHPEVADRKFDELDLLLSLIHKAVFIGEVGIDGSARYSNTFEKQKIIFDSTLCECEKVGGRVISIHSRAAVPTVLSIIRKYPNCGTPILHWFSGTITELREAIGLGCYFSVNSQMLKSKKGKDLVSRIPLELLLPESDGPFANVNGKPIMPWEAINVCQEIEILWDKNADNVKNIFLSNLETILSIKKEYNYK